MKLYWDTSALIRAWRLGKAPRGHTRSHALAEFYGTLTGRGLTVTGPDGPDQMKLSPADTLRALERTTAHLEFAELAPADVRAALAAAVAANVQGPNIHDWLHARAAAQSPATQLVTLNAKHFRQLAPKLRLADPAAALAAAPAA